MVIGFYLIFVVYLTCLFKKKIEKRKNKDSIYKHLSFISLGVPGLAIACGQVERYIHMLYRNCLVVR